MRLPRIFFRRAVRLSLAVAFCDAQFCAAQRLETTLDAGGVAIQYADTLSGVAGTVTPHVFGDWGNRIADLSGTYSQFGSNWSIQGTASGSLFSRVGGSLGELSLFGGGSTHRDGSRTGELLANARLHLQRRSNELFAGIGGGKTSFGNETRTILLGELGAEMDLENGNATFSFTPVTMGDSIKYADSQLSFVMQRPHFDLSALVGGRLGDQLTSLGGTTRVWGNVGVSRWLTPNLAIVASGGSYPIDPTQGYPGGRFVSLGLRIASAARRVSSPSIDASASQSDSSGASVVKFLTDRNAGVVTFRIFAPSAQSVELTGDFTNWDPLAAAPVGDGWWTVARPLIVGKYQMNLRIDGGKWVVPPGLLAIVDEFGGNVGLLVIE
ncbi:MAG TPA: glycogen-binding domain-containing protein [Gemmatimonadaceae bacterium]